MNIILERVLYCSYVFRYILLGAKKKSRRKYLLFFPAGLFILISFPSIRPPHQKKDYDIRKKQKKKKRQTRRHNRPQRKECSKILKDHQAKRPAQTPHKLTQPEQSSEQQPQQLKEKKKKKSFFPVLICHGTGKRETHIMISYYIISVRFLYAVVDPLSSFVAQQGHYHVLLTYYIDI